MPMFNYTLTGVLNAPEGAKLNETSTGIVMPDGCVLKLWESFEMLFPDGDDVEDLYADDLSRLGISYDGDMARFENKEG